MDVIIEVFQGRGNHFRTMYANIKSVDGTPLVSSTLNYALDCLIERDYNVVNIKDFYKALRPIDLNL